MTVFVSLRPQQVPDFVKGMERSVRRAITDGLKACQQEALVILRETTWETAPHPPVDTGKMLKSWRAKATTGALLISNPVAYSAVMEAGAGPHRPNLNSIARWVARKFGYSTGVLARAVQMGLITGYRKRQPTKPATAGKKLVRHRPGWLTERGEASQVYQFARLVGRVVYGIQRRGLAPRRVLARSRLKLDALVMRQVGRSVEHALASARSVPF